MKCMNPPSGKNAKTILKCRLLKFLPRLLSIKHGIENLLNLSTYRHIVFKQCVFCFVSDMSVHLYFDLNIQTCFLLFIYYHILFLYSS